MYKIFFDTIQNDCGMYLPYAIVYPLLHLQYFHCTLLGSYDCATERQKMSQALTFFTECQTLT